MTIRISTLVLLTALAAVGQTPEPIDVLPPKPVQTPPLMLKLLGDYGGWWKALSDEARDSYLEGYTTAMQKVQFITHNECMKNARSVTPGPEFNAKLQESLNLCALSETFDYKSDRALRAGLDRFYKNLLNTSIPPEFALEYLRDDLKRNKTPSQLADELNEWRRTMKSWSTGDPASSKTGAPTERSH